MQKIRTVSVIIGGLLLSTPLPLLAQEFVSLTTIPGITDFTDATNLVNGLLRAGIVAAALLAVIQIIRGGFVYLTTEAVSSKGEARKLITDALTGLFLVLVSVLILTIINPDILKVNFLSNNRTPVGTDAGLSETESRIERVRPQDTACLESVVENGKGYKYVGEVKIPNTTNKNCVYALQDVSPNSNTSPGIPNTPQVTPIDPNSSRDGQTVREYPLEKGCPPAFEENGATYVIKKEEGRTGTMVRCSYGQV